MSFDWQAFLDKQGIEYVTRGPSTSRGNLYIHCPFCGDADEGRHMGVSIENKGWGCWRNQAHRGRAPQRLIQALIGCSWAGAATIIGKRLGGSLWGAQDSMGQMLAGFDKSEKLEPRKALKLPDDFRPLPRAPKMFLEYMLDRGYDHYAIEHLCEHFNLRFAMTGLFAYRIIFPIREENGSLVTWTGRAINDDAELRYKTLSYLPHPKFPNDPISHGPITDYLFGLPGIIHGGEYLVIVEGPFDAIRLWAGLRGWYGLPATRPQVTCLFGKAVSDTQLDRLAMLKEKYKAMFLVLDPEASADALQLSQQLSVVGVQPHFLKGKHDPGAMTFDEMDGLFDALAERSAAFANSGGMP